MQIKMTTNAPDISRQLSTIALRQLPFAISTALNAVGRRARDRERADIDQYFELRTPWLKKAGAMPFLPSRKDNLTAIIAVADKVAALNATGGIKQKNAGKEMAVPLSDAGGGQSARSILNPGKETLPPSKWPGKIVKPKTGKRSKRGKKPAPFIIKSKGTGQTYIAVREGKDDNPLKILYTFVNQAQVAKTWPLVENVERFVGANYERVFTHAIQQAIDTAR